MNFRKLQAKINKAIPLGDPTPLRIVFFGWLIRWPFVPRKSNYPGVVLKQDKEGTVHIRIDDRHKFKRQVVAGYPMRLGYVPKNSECNHYDASLCDHWEPQKYVEGERVTVTWLTPYGDANKLSYVILS